MGVEKQKRGYRDLTPDERREKKDKEMMERMPYRKDRVNLCLMISA